MEGDINRLAAAMARNQLEQRRHEDRCGSRRGQHLDVRSDMAAAGGKAPSRQRPHRSVSKSLAVWRVIGALRMRICFHCFTARADGGREIVRSVARSVLPRPLFEEYQNYSCRRVHTKPPPHSLLGTDMAHGHGIVWHAGSNGRRYRRAPPAAEAVQEDMHPDLTPCWWPRRTDTL